MKTLYLIFFLTLILFGCLVYQKVVGRVEFENFEKPIVKQSKVETLEEMIIRKSKEANLDPAVNLKIAFKESNFNPMAKNPSSSAKGIYQFIDKTWANYCQGDMLDANDNISCFVKIFPKHPTWWVTHRK